MTFFQSILLGIVQGMTEFIPVSSSGHLVIVPYLLGWEFPPDQAFAFDVLVQVATLAGVIAFFWRDILAITRATVSGLVKGQPFADLQARLGWYLILATIPALIAGLLFKDAVEKAFDNPQATAFFLLITAGLLVVAERIGKRDRNLESLTWKDALLIGVFQALALLPGISRSGATISGAMGRNLERPTAARFSFLMSIPVMLGAGLVATLDLLRIPNLDAFLPVFIPGFIMAAVVGYLVIKWLLAFLSRYPLYAFAVYCVVLSLITLALGSL